MTITELIAVAIGSTAAIIGAINEWRKHSKAKKEKEKQKAIAKEEEIKKNKSIEGLRIRGEIRRVLERLIEEYKFNSMEVLRFHNSGDAMAPINSKLKVTIEYEILAKKDGEIIPGLESKKKQWQARQIDSYMERFIEDILLDKIIHTKDIEETPANRGIRGIYSSVIGKELLFYEIGFVGYDYLVLATQRERTPRLLSQNNMNDIEYYIKSQANNILAMIKSTKGL